MDGSDRRKNPRFEGEFLVDLLNMGDDPQIPPDEPVVRGMALDVSRQGLRLRSAYNVNVGSFISAILYFKGHESLALCEVMWKRVEQGQFLYGLFIREWSGLDPELSSALGSMESPPKTTTPAA